MLPSLLSQEIQVLKSKLKIIIKTESSETKKLYEDIRDMESKLEIAQLFNLYYIRLVKAISLIDKNDLRQKLMDYLAVNKNLKIFSILDDYYYADFLKDKYRSDLNIEVDRNLDNMLGFIAFYDMISNEELEELVVAGNPDYF